jgi:excisionase family DNA binding protein
LSKKKREYVVDSLWTVEQVAKYLEVTPYTVREWVYRGDLPAYKVPLPDGSMAKVGKAARLYFIHSDVKARAAKIYGIAGEPQR